MNAPRHGQPVIDISNKARGPKPQKERQTKMHAYIAVVQVTGVLFLFAAACMAYARRSN